MTVNYAKFIPEKFKHRLVPHKTNLTTHALIIEHGSGAGMLGVDIGLNDDTLNLPEDKFKQRILWPALCALETAIAKRNIHSPQ